MTQNIHSGTFPTELKKNKNKNKNKKQRTKNIFVKAYTWMFTKALFIIFQR